MCVAGCEAVLHKNDGSASWYVAAPAMQFIHMPDFYLPADWLENVCVCVAFCPVDSLYNGKTVIDNFGAFW